MKKVFEDQGTGDPMFFTNLKKAQAAAIVDVGENMVSYGTLQKHIKETGSWGKEIEWLGDCITIVKREVL